MGGAQAFYPKEDNAPGLVSLRLPIPEAISSLGCHASLVSPPEKQQKSIKRFIYLKKELSQKI